MNNPPKNHHFVPKCYLSSFTNSQNNFWKKRNDNGRLSLTNPTKVCYEPNANRIRTKQILHLNNLTDAYYIEKNAFKTQENNYGKIITKLLKFKSEPQIVNKIHYQLFLETLLTIKRRNPLSRFEIIEKFKASFKYEGGVKEFFNFLSEETGVKKLTPEVEEFIKTYLSVEAQNPDRLHDMYLSAFINQRDYDTIRNLATELFALKQYILFAPISQQFITSDNPGFLVSNGILSNLGGFGGNYEFYFPLSPLTCLYLNSNMVEANTTLQKAIYNILVNESQVKTINENTQSLSNKYLLAFSKKSLELL